MNINNNWDLIIFNPLLIIVAVSLFIFGQGRKYKSWSKWLFLSQVIFLELPLAMNLQNTFHSISDTYISSSIVNDFIILSILNINLFVIILLVPFSFLIKLKKHKKWLGLGICIIGGLGLIFELISYATWSKVLGSLCLSLVSCFGVYYYNATSCKFNYKYNPIRTVLIITPLSIISILIGNWIYFLFVNGSINQQLSNTNQIGVLLLSLCCIIITGFLITFSNDNALTSTPFNLNEVALLQQFKKSVFKYLILILVFVIMYKSFWVSNLNNLLWGQILHNNGYDDQKILLFLRLKKELLTFGFIFGTSCLGLFLLSKFQVLKTIIGIFALFFVTLTVSTFNNNIYINLSLEFINGFLYGIAFSILITLILMWHYRIKKNYVFVLSFLTIVIINFLFSLIINLLLISKVGIFNNQIYDFIYFNNQNMINQLRDIHIMIFAILSSLSLLMTLFIYMKKQIILAEYLNPAKKLTPLINQILQNQIIKSKHVTEISERVRQKDQNSK